MKHFVLLVVLLVLGLCDDVTGKECTNIPTQLSSHTFRYELLASQNDSWKQEMFEHYHLTPTDDSVWSNLLPRKNLREEDGFDWQMMYRKIKNQGFKPSGDFLKDVSLHNVILDPSSIHWQAQQTNLEYLLMLDVDRLVWSFRKTAGLSTTKTPHKGWEAADCELRGHFVGHYLSASAHMWASTHSILLQEKMSAVVSALSDCQKKMDTGYLSAFPSELFDRLEAKEPVWAPYYTIHKIFSGLLDQFTIADNKQALKMATWMAEFFYERVQKVVSKYTMERHYMSLNEETGGMNDVLYRLFSITGNPKHLVLAHLFDKPCFLGLLALQNDGMSGFHANTHIPVVVGAQMRYEVTGDALYKEIGSFFMDIVSSSHSYATGGTSVAESDPKRLASTLQTENEESCTTYNMLKVSRHLFRWTKEMAYADYYERALTNGVLGVQRGTDPGVMIYMLPMAPGSSKSQSYHGWGTQFDSFWCCYGTGIESFSKLGDSIYFERNGSPGLYIIQYISSSLDWKSGNFLLSQKVDPVVAWDPYLHVTFTVSADEGSSQSSTLYLRIPFWSHSEGAKASVNSQDLTLPAPGNFISITKVWKDGDTLSLQLPISLRTEAIKGTPTFLSSSLSLQLPISLRTEAIKDDREQYASLQATFYGPYLLAGHSRGDFDIKTGSATSISQWLTPVPADYNHHLFSFIQNSGDSTFVLTNTKPTVAMRNLPKSGTDSATQASFRVISKYSSGVWKAVMLEPIDFPGSLIMSQGKGENLAVLETSSSSKGNSVFLLVNGLDGNDGTVSLESVSGKGCYVCNSGQNLKLMCNSHSTSSKGAYRWYSAAASFKMIKGISEYHSMSFVARGAKRNFLMAPLFSMRDESYTVYFNIQP